MLVSESIMRLYANVLHEDIVDNRIRTEDIRAGIQKMAKDYSPENANFTSSDREFPNYNDTAFRCAYLHKYAPFHTYIVLEAMLKILQEKKKIFQELLDSGPLKLCCLGGGPGSEVIGLLTALNAVFDSYKMSVTVIDCMAEWESTFRSLIQELRFGEYGAISYGLKNDNDFEWSYLGANLLENMTNAVNKSIGSASFITMVKFISAASCTTAELMVEKIFRVMKPGALVLFIDNAAGGFTQLIDRVSRKNNFEMLMSPRRHVLYDEEDFKIERFGYSSCCKSTVTIFLLRKRGRPQASRNPTSHVDSSNCSRLSSQSNLGSHQPIKHNSYKLPSVNDNLNHQFVSHKSGTKGSNLYSHQPNERDSSKLPTVKDNLNHQSVSHISPTRGSNFLSHQSIKQDSSKLPSMRGNLNLQSVSNISPTRGSNFLSHQPIKRDSTKLPSVRDNLNHPSVSHKPPASGSNLNRKQPSKRDSSKLQSMKDNLNRQTVTYDFHSVNNQENRRNTSQGNMNSVRMPVGPQNTELSSGRNRRSNDTNDDGCCTCCVIS